MALFFLPVYKYHTDKLCCPVRETFSQILCTIPKYTVICMLIKIYITLINEDMLDFKISMGIYVTMIKNLKSEAAIVIIVSIIIKFDIRKQDINSFKQIPLFDCCIASLPTYKNPLIKKNNDISLFLCFFPRIFRK